MRDGRALLALALGLAALGGGLALARPGPILSGDQAQPRLDVPAPIPDGTLAVSQTFVAGHDGLSAIDLLAVVFPGEVASLDVRLSDAPGRLVASASFQDIEHNAPLRLEFVPEPESAGQRYTLTLDGPAGNRATVWAYSLDGYASGELTAGGQPAPGDLHFSTSYTYQPTEMARDLAAGLGQVGRLALPLWLTLFAPGLLALELAYWRAGQGERAPPGNGGGQPRLWERWGVALGLSLSLVALLWLWATALGFRLSAQAVFAIHAAAGLGWLALAGWRWLRRPRWPALSGHDAAMAVILLAGLGARLLAVRDLAFPPWVDSPHHYLIARLFDESGRVPANYLPLLPVDRYVYHFGFHALAVSFHWLARLELDQAMLPLGQVLNALAPLACYALAAGLTGRRRAGLVAAFFVAVVSLFPAYYLAWGRYTQLAGVLIFSPALVFAWWHISAGRRHTAPTFGPWLLALLAAGLFLTHVRLFFFFGVFVVAALMARRPSGRAGWTSALAAAAMAFVLALPWIVRLSTQFAPRALAEPQRLAAAPGYNAFPVEYFQSTLERGWIAAALLALGWGLVRRERIAILVGLWVAAVLALLNVGPGTLLVNNNSWAITLFVPGGVLLGWAADRLLSLQSWVLRLAAQAALVALAAFAGARGLKAQVEIVRPVTVLATAQDAQAIDWVADHTPPEAVFLVNGWRWLPNIWASPDGGAWLWPRAGRRTTVPPLDYASQAEWRAEVNTFNEAAMNTVAADPGSPEALELLRRAGVTHVYIGAIGGEFRPEAFAASPAYRLIFSNGGAWVYELLEN